MSSLFSRIYSSTFEKIPYAGPYFKKDQVKRNLQFVGFSLIGYYALKLLYNISKNAYHLALHRSLSNTYGVGSWALIASISNDIGKGFSKALAREGFNIVLIGTDIEELSDFASTLTDINPSIETKALHIDFSKSLEEGFFQDILKQLKDLDISILVNNVSFGDKDQDRSFDSIEEPELKQMILLNTVPMVLMTRILIKKMRNRPTGKRSAIINVSSQTGVRPEPYKACYSAAKAFSDNFSRGLSIEFEKLDILSVRPPQYYRFSSRYAKACLSELGKVDYTSGSLKYKMRSWKRDIVPDVVYNKLIKYSHEVKLDRSGNNIE